jgi:hypothetical protein
VTALLSAQWRRLAVAVAIGGSVVAACGSEANEQTAPLRAVVSDADVVADIEPTIDELPIDPVRGVMHLLGPASDDDPVALVEVFFDAGAQVPRQDRQLDDGAWVQLDSVDEPRRRREATFLGPAGEYVHLGSSDPDIDLDDVIALVGQVTIDGSDLELDRAGWDVLASVPIPVFDDGFVTRYPIADGEVTIYANPEVAGAMTLYRYGSVVDAEVNGVPALRYDETSPTRGYIFLLDGVIVDLRDDTPPGTLSDAELLAIAEGARIGAADV